MIEQTIAQRYARALYSFASETGGATVDVVLGQLNTFAEALHLDGTLAPALENRYFDELARERVIQSLSERLKLDASVTNFLRLLIRKGRMALFPFIRDVYEVLANRHNGREIMTLVSAVALSDDFVKSLETHFANVTGKKMVTRRKVNADVLGGVRVHVGEKVYDYTVQQQIEHLKERMLA